MDQRLKSIKMLITNGMLKPGHDMELTSAYQALEYAWDIEKDKSPMLRSAIVQLCKALLKHQLSSEQ